uniref:Far upstream element binding protein 3 n=1 Tax=Homo sapiens TaxID=9606 RepID=A0A494C1K6_HUMAN
MAELVQGQSAPVGMKAEGFVDALHRVRQKATGVIVLEEGLHSGA